MDYSQYEHVRGVVCPILLLCGCGPIILHSIIVEDMLGTFEAFRYVGLGCSGPAHCQKGGVMDTIRGNDLEGRVRSTVVLVHGRVRFYILEPFVKRPYHHVAA